MIDDERVRVKRGAAHIPAQMRRQEEYTELYMYSTLSDPPLLTAVMLSDEEGYYIIVGGEIIRIHP